MKTKIGCVRNQSVLEMNGIHWYKSAGKPAHSKKPAAMGRDPMFFLAGI